MTQEEKKFNEKCAKFLGWEYNTETCRWNENMTHDYSFIYDEDLKFHSDWNWIMEVLNGISKLDFSWNVTSKKINIYSHLGDKRGTFDCMYETNCPQNVILDTAKAINQFLTWYENNKNN